jgi:hypothetical protein
MTQSPDDTRNTASQDATRQDDAAPDATTENATGQNTAAQNTAAQNTTAQNPVAQNTDEAGGFRKPDKAYTNLDFLQSKDARQLRILAEYLEPERRFEHYQIDDTIVFMGSARFKPRDVAEDTLRRVEAGESVVSLEKARHDVWMSQYYEAARELARRLTVWSKDLDETERRFVVCTGGGPGVMEAANRGASEAKGMNIGLSITLPLEQHENPYVTRELGFEFHYFFMRKFWFTYLAKAIIFFPGGFGTLDELFEMLTLLQTRKVRKHMPIVLFGSDFWRETINFDALVKYGTINEEDKNLFTITDDLDEAYEIIKRELAEYGLREPGAHL